MAGVLRRNVLIFHAGALGDFVLTWPVAMGVGRVMAQSRVFYVTQGGKGELARRVLGVEAKDVEGGWQHLFGDVRRVPEGVRRVLEGTRLVVNMVAGEGDAWVGNVKEVSRGAEVVTVRPRPGEGWKGGHVSEYLLEELAGQRVLQAAVGQMVRSVREKGAGVVWKGGSTVVLHPGSGSREKCWPVGRWVELAGRLRAGGERVRIVMGEVERERFSGEDVKRLEGAGEVRWLGGYGELLEELAGAKAFVGNDSGPGHLAGVIGVPTVSLFGVTDPGVWGPMGPRVGVVRGEGMEGVGVEEVMGEVGKLTAEG